MDLGIQVARSVRYRKWLTCTCGLVVCISLGEMMIAGTYVPRQDEDDEDQTNDWGHRLLTPLAVLLMFFAGCITISLHLNHSQADDFAGIYYLVLVAIVFMIYNGTVLTPSNIRTWIRGKKYGWGGVILVLAVGAIVFGFLDNFGMKLGTDALEPTFVKLFANKLNTHETYPNSSDAIKENIEQIDKWSGSSEWPRIVNQVTRHLDTEKHKTILDNLLGLGLEKKPDTTQFAKQFDTLFNAEKGQPKIDFMNSVGHFVRSIYDPEKTKRFGLNITKEVKYLKAIGDFVKACKEKYAIIDDSKAMLGNTFSDGIGALLGAAVANLFTYLTANDGVTLAMNIPDGLTIAGPVIEALFIMFGCMIPIYINIAMKNFK